MARKPLANSYGAAVGLVAFSLIPFLSLTGAITPLIPAIPASTHLHRPP